MGSSQRETLRVVRVSLVKPSNPSKRQITYLSGIDQLLRGARPNRTLLLYRTDTDPSDAAEALSRGISSALVPYYLMAGRLCEDQAEGGRLAIDCNDRGVAIIEARCELPFADIERHSFGMRPLFDELVPMGDRKRSDQLDDPLASFQVTSFEGGGLAVGIAALHSVVDGHSMWSFIGAVGQACRGESISPEPLHARILLKPEVFAMNTRMHSREDENPAESVQPPSYFGSQDQDLQKIIQPANLTQHTIIRFSPEMLSTLKEACLSSTSVAESSRPGFRISTYQALTAYLWKRLTMAQKLDDEAAVEFRVASEVRRRMIPPLTSAFFGNAIVGIPTPCTVKELLSESLGDTAMRLRRSIGRADDVYIKKAIREREKLDISKINLGRPIVSATRNGVGFPVYEAGDFGWGSPDAVRPPWDQTEGVFTYYAGKDAKSIEVTVALCDNTSANFFSAQLYPDDVLRPLFPYHDAVSEQPHEINTA